MKNLLLSMILLCSLQGMAQLTAPGILDISHTPAQRIPGTYADPAPLNFVAADTLIIPASVQFIKIDNRVYQVTRSVQLTEVFPYPTSFRGTGSTMQVPAKYLNGYRQFAGDLAPTTLLGTLPDNFSHADMSPYYNVNPADIITPEAPVIYLDGGADINLSPSLPLYEDNGSAQYFSQLWVDSIYTLKKRAAPPAKKKKPKAKTTFAKSTDPLVTFIWTSTGDKPAVITSPPEQSKK